jgi:ABC-type multidrug transport system ATPase subunit
MREEAFAEVEGIMRRIRRLPTGAEDDFAISTPDQIIQQFDRITSLIGLVAIAISALGLLVGGIGVMNIMLVSVTERTREIGVRKALGARRRDIVGQFLVEAMTLTGAGGMLGIVIAVLITMLVGALVPSLPSVVPAWALITGFTRVGGDRRLLRRLARHEGRATRPGRGAAIRIMALLESCTSLSKILRLAPAVREHLAGHFRRRAARPDRPQRRGQIHPAAHSLRPTRARFRLHLHAPQYARRLRAAGGRVPGKPDGARGRRRAIAGERLDESGARRAHQPDTWAAPASPMAPCAPNRSPADGSAASPSPARWRNQPDLLFLDEPTNHLDLEGILWLEKLLSTASFASVVVSHDRYFLDNVVNDMAEIDRAYPEGILRVEGATATSWKRRRSSCWRNPAARNRWPTGAREVEWLRRGAKARTGKSQSARIDNAGRLMRELVDLESRTAKGVAQIDFTATDRRTKRLVSVENISKELGGRTLFRDLSFTLTPGTRLGLLGLNGTGKTTLLRMLAGETRPDSGRIERAAALRIVYFDQAREQLDPEQTLRQGLGAHGDTVIFQRPPDPRGRMGQALPLRRGQLDRPMSSLSGGEQARVLIARLMLQPADLLLLDEPTNDLDIPTLEVLEDSLTDFPGALVLVTHDRYLLDRVSTAVLGLDGARRRAALRRLLAMGAGQGRAARRAQAWPSRRAPETGRSPPKRSSPTTKPASGSRWRRASWKPSARSRPSAPKCIPPRWSPTGRACRPATPNCNPPKNRCTRSTPAGRSWFRSPLRLGGHDGEVGGGLHQAGDVGAHRQNAVVLAGQQSHHQGGVGVGPDLLGARRAFQRNAQAGIEAPSSDWTALPRGDHRLNSCSRAPSSTTVADASRGMALRLLPPLIAAMASGMPPISLQHAAEDAHGVAAALVDVDAGVPALQAGDLDAPAFAGRRRAHPTCAARPC